MVKEKTQSSQDAMHIAAVQTASPPPVSSGDNITIINSESKDSETPPSQLPPQKGEVSMVDELRDFNDMFDLDQTQQSVAAKAAKAIVDVSTEPTDVPALPQEQKDTPSVLECNSFLQILEKRVCKAILSAK